jgi:MFS family permease/dihydrofolate reductase
MMELSAPAASLAPAGPDPRRWWALALLCGAFFMVLLDGTITIVALPSIGADFRFSEQGLQWVLSAYALTFGGLLLLGGRAADLLGRRRVFMAGVLFFTAASLMCGLAWSPTALFAARVVQGAGAAIMTPTALSIISTTFSGGSERNKALGIWGALGGIGAATAWLIGGPIVDGPGWRWIFLINVPVGLAVLTLSPVFLRESRAALSRRSYDPAGALTITGALVLLVYAVVKAPQAGWADVRTILPLTGSALLLAAFALIESRHHAPLVPLRFSPPAPSAAAAVDNANERRTEMGKIIMSENVSLDGVVEDPAGDEGFRVGGWVGRITDRKEVAKVTLDEALGTEALLLGRRSYEWLAARWPSRSGELADRLNGLPKYVVSSTLDEPKWNNSTVIKGGVVNEVSKLKQELNGNIVIPGSFQLLRTLIEHDLVDELRLKIYPVVLGAGKRLFGESSDKKPLRLINARTLDDGIAFLTYQRVRDA